MPRSFLVVLLAATGCGAFGSSVESDKRQIEKSLRTMDRSVTEEQVSARLDLVEELGISGLAGEDAPQAGDVAPEFELRPVRFYDFQMRDGVTTDNAGQLYEPVRLSSFRGKPVVLIFGSYT